LALGSGVRSKYYPAIALPMNKSLPNFLFEAVDPAGTVSLDKIPGSCWEPAVFITIFDFSTWSVLALDMIAMLVASTWRGFLRCGCWSELWQSSLSA
jgi:hypothetical protein